VTPLTHGEIVLIAALAAVVIVIAVWFRNPGWWVDALLWVAVAVGVVLLVFVMVR
jgi:hypothetical protein